MNNEQLDFAMIQQALQHSYQQLLSSSGEVSTSTLSELEQAQEDLQAAFSCATSIDKKYLSFTKTL